MKNVKKTYRQANPENDDVEEMLHAGKITLGELQRNAANILGFLLKSPSILILADRICEEELEAMNTKEEDDVDQTGQVLHPPEFLRIASHNLQKGFHIQSPDQKLHIPYQVHS